MFKDTVSSFVIMDICENHTDKEVEEDVLLFSSREAILSAEELITTFNESTDRKSTTTTSSTSSSVLNDINAGLKLNNPTGSWLESNRIKARLRSLYEHMSIPRVFQKGQLSQAVWDCLAKRAKVTKPCGKHWNTMGHIYKNQLHIFPEEALFLIESGSLQLLDGRTGIPMPLQQAFEILLMDNGNDCTLEGYHTYSRLVRLGYKVLRHQRDVSMVVSNN